MRFSFFRKKPVRVYCSLIVFASLSSVRATQFKRIEIQPGEQATEIERNVATLLAERISEPSGIQVRVTNSGQRTVQSPSELLILMGTPEAHSAIRAEFDTHRIPPLTQLAPGPEGFLLRAISN